MPKRDLYEIQGDKLIRKRKHCPKCGVGFFLAEHKDRATCGHCQYTEFKNKDPKPEAKPDKDKAKTEAKPKVEKKEDKPAPGAK